MKWLAALLLAANVGLFAWSSLVERGGEVVLPAPPRAPQTIRLVGEPLAEPPAPVSIGDGASPTGMASAPGVRSAPRLSTRSDPDQPPASAYDRGAVRPLPPVRLPETMTERVDPGLLPDELDAAPPTVVPIVEEEPPGSGYRWSGSGPED